MDRGHLSLTAAQIDQVTAAFYAKVQTHPDLSLIFAEHVTDWPAHIAKIASFWRNAILREKSYAGNPMLKHRDAGNVRVDHFPQWLALFDETLNETLPAELAHAWSDLAHRIGRSLQMGLSVSTVPS